jgi:hypothetical protein
MLAALLFGLTALLVVVFDLPEPLSDRSGALLFVDVVALGPAAVLLLTLHRRFPLTVAAAVTLLTAVSSLAAGAGLVCLASVAARRRPREIAGIAGLSVACGLVFEQVYPGRGRSTGWSRRR